MHWLPTHLNSLQAAEAWASSPGFGTIVSSAVPAEVLKGHCAAVISLITRESMQCGQGPPETSLRLQKAQPRCKALGQAQGRWRPLAGDPPLKSPKKQSKKGEMAAESLYVYEGMSLDYSSPPLSLGNMVQDPQWMPRLVDHTDPVYTVFSYTYIPLHFKEALNIFSLAYLNC